MLSRKKFKPQVLVQGSWKWIKDPYWGDFRTYGSSREADQVCKTHRRGTDAPKEFYRVIGL